MKIIHLEREEKQAVYKMVQKGVTGGMERA